MSIEKLVKEYIGEQTIALMNAQSQLIERGNQIVKLYDLIKALTGTDFDKIKSENEFLQKIDEELNTPRK